VNNTTQHNRILQEELGHEAGTARHHSNQGTKQNTMGLSSLNGSLCKVHHMYVRMYQSRNFTPHANNFNKTVMLNTTMSENYTKAHKRKMHTAEHYA